MNLVCKAASVGDSSTCWQDMLKPAGAGAISGQNSGLYMLSMGLSLTSVTVGRVNLVRALTHRLSVSAYVGSLGAETERDGQVKMQQKPIIDWQTTRGQVSIKMCTLSLKLCCGFRRMHSVPVACGHQPVPTPFPSRTHSR